MPVTDDDFAATVLTSAIFGAALPAALSAPDIRRAWAADHKARAAAQPGRPASAILADPALSRWSVLERPAAPGGEDASPLLTPLAVNENGYVLFSDGIIYRPGSDDFLTLDGRVFDRNANCTGVVGPRQDPIVPIARPDTPTAPADAAQDDLFGGQPSGQPTGQAAQPPTIQTANESVRALSLYQLLQTSDAQVYNVRVADILVNVDVKQFKAGADPNTGVVAGEELHGEFQKIPAKPIVVLQKLDGTLEVVTGRHRLDLAKRNGLETIPANIIKEADGWTPETAALLDAFDNILDEKGSYADYVPFFRKAGIPREVAEAYGLLARPKGRLSFEIAMNGCDDLVSFVAAGDKRVTPDVAAAICRAVPVPAAAREAGALTGQAARYDAIQHYVIRAVIDEGLRADQAEIMANGIRAEYAKRAEANTIRQDDLFGADETFNTEMALRAKYAGDQIAKINLDLRALKIVSGKQSGNVAAKDSLLKKYNIKGPDDAAGIERAIQELETLHHRWQHYYTDAELSKEADAFVKKSLRLDPEDQPPVIIVQPDAPDSAAAPAARTADPVTEPARAIVEEDEAAQARAANPDETVERYVDIPAPRTAPAVDTVAGDRASIVRNIQAERATPLAGHIWGGPAGAEIPSAGGERIEIAGKQFLPLMGSTLERTTLTPDAYPADAIVWEPVKLPLKDVLIPNTVLGKRIQRPANLSDEKIAAVAKAYIKANNAYADAVQALGERPATGAAKQKAWDKKMETLKANFEKQSKPYEQLVKDLEAFAEPYGNNAVGHYVQDKSGTYRIVKRGNARLHGKYLQPDGTMLHVLDRDHGVYIARTRDGKTIEVTHWTRPSHWSEGQETFESRLILNTRYAIGEDGRPTELFAYGEDGRPTAHLSLRDGDPVDPRHPERVHFGNYVDGYDGDGVYRNGQRVDTLTPEELNAAPAEPAPQATADELPLGSPAAPNGARPESSAQTSAPTPEVTRNGRKQAESDAARKERQARRAAQRARMVTAEDLGVGGLTDEQGNGPDFVPVRPEESDSTIKGETLAKRKLKPDTNVRLGFDFHIDARDDALKIAKFTSAGEDGRAHRYAVRNIIPLVKRAGVAVRQKNYNDTTDSRVSKEFERLFIPYFFEGRLYVAVVSQRYQDVRGVHALETLDVFRAETRPEVSSDESKGSERPTGGFHALNTITIPNEGPNDNTLSLTSIQRVIDNPKKGGNQNPRLLDPDGNGGLTETPCTAQDVADRIRADIADFVGRARYRADHRLQPIDTDDGRFTMGEGVTVEVSDGTAAVTGLAGKSPAEAAKLLDAIQAQLPPGVALAVTDRLAPDVQNLIQAHNENALTYRIWEAIDKYAKIDYRFEDGKHILTFPEKDTRTYQENAAIVKAVKALLPEGTPLTLENTKSRMLQALAAHTPTTDAQPTPVARQGVPESPASPESPVRPSGVEDAELPDTPQAQRDAVRNLHQGRNTWLKAPNGKRTKLPQKLWVDVRTPNFKRFFGDWENHPETIHPKLLDENGEPRIFWHNSPAAGIRVFDPTRSRAAMDIQGTYFSPDKIDAAGYGQHAYPVFIALKRPADQATAYAGFTPGSTADAGAIRAQELRDQGYDGVIVEDGDAPSGIAEVIVLDPNAIKSAGRNAGAYDPSNPDILANQAPTAQAPTAQAPGAQPPANQAPAQPDARSPGDPFSVLRSPFSIVNGADIVSAAVYPNGGRVPVAGSPAAAAGTPPPPPPPAVPPFPLLTGKLPGIVAQKNRGPRNALGWYLPKTADIFVRAQLFGLIDQSDLTVLKDGLAKRGFFRHENPAWCVTQTKDSIRREKALSNQKLAKAADLLIRRRTRAGVHQGAAAKVMAHELWHAISASGGVPPRDHGNLLGQIYNLKKCMANALPENTFATDDVLRQEAKEFIIWWRGTGEHEPYFDQPHEAYAEMGAAFFLAPEAVKEQAPIYYDAMLDGLRNYPQAFDALAAIRDQRAAGGDLDAFQRRLQTTWQAAHEARVRKLRDEVGKPTEDERKARIVQLLWNRHAPVMLILQRAQKDVRARLRQDLKDGNITQADHDAKIKELDEDLLDLRHHTLLFTHRHGPSKLFLADIWGKIGQQAEALGVTMNDLNLYLHLRRVEELKGRATALGIDPPTARAMLNQFFKRLGYAKVRAIARLAKTFHAVWQHAILENPDVIAMLGPDKIAELKQNAHYITMRHVPTPEELQAATVAWEKTKRAKSGGDPLEPIVRELLGHKAYTSGVYGADAHTGVASALKRLQGSLRQTESPLTATAETGLAILEAAQRNALTVSLVRALKAVGFDEIAVLKPTDDVITNDRIGTVQYMENGKRVTLAAPRSVVDALSGAPHEIPYLTAATRFLSAGFTTNNPAFIIPAALRDLDSLYVQMPGMKRGFAQWCAAYANLIPGVGPLRHARAAVNLGNWVNWSAQFIPPHVMKHISQTPIGRLLYGQNTVAYWTSVGAKIARIIQHMDFEGTLRQAHEARLAGDDAKAEALEYCATMARHALEDGVLLTYNQQLADDYLKGGLQRLFDKYHLKYDDDRRHLPIPAKIAKRAQDYRETLRQRLLGANAIQDPKKRMAALAAVAASPLADLYRTTVWDSAGFLSEYQSMMVKLAGWAYLHHESAAGNLPPLPADPAGNAAPQGATPVARQGAPFSVPRSPFSGGGEAASSPAYDANRRRQIALYAADRAGDPNFANKGILLGQIETFFTGFLNARMKGLSRTAARFKEAPGEYTLKALALLSPTILGYLLYDGTLKRAVQTLFFDGQEPDDEQLNTLAGNLYTTLAWEQDALKNVSPYTRLNYFTTPIWMSADKSVTLTLKTPIPEEIKPLHYALTALLNRTTLDTGMPNVGLNDALAEVYGNLAPGSGDRGVAIALLDTWAAPWFSGDNPWQSYRNANQFSDDAFRARYLTPMPLIKEQLIDTWNGSPLVSLSRLRRNDQYGNVPQDLQALHALLQAPIVGPVLARFASIDSNGRAQTVSQYAQIAEARKAALRIQAKAAAEEYRQSGLLPDTLKNLPPEEQRYAIDALLDAVKDQAAPKSAPHETLRKALNIPFQDLREPALRATQSNP